MKDVLTAEQAAEQLNYNIHHVYKLLRQGKIRAEQFNRVWLIPSQEVRRIKDLQRPSGRLPRSEPEQEGN